MAAGDAPEPTLSLRLQQVCTHGVLVSALVATPFGLDRFLLPKLAVLALLAVVGLAAAAMNGQLWWSRSFTALAALLVVLLVSSLLSVDPTTALLGSASRRMGVVSWLLLGAVAVLGGASRDLIPVKNLLRTLVAVGAGVAVCALGQVVAGGVATRPTAPLGSAAATGAVLAVSLVVTLAPVLGPAMWPTPLTGAAAALQLVALLSTRDRGAWLGAVLGAVVVCLPRWKALGARTRGAWLVAAVALVAVVAVFTPDTGVHGRMEVARMGVRAVAERPLLGWGADLGRPALHPRISEGFEARVGDQPVLDRAHDVVLDVALWGGALAVLALLWFGVAVGRGVWRQRSEWWAPAVGAALVAYAVLLLFGFPAAHTDAAMWLLIGVAAPVGAARLRAPVWAAAVATAAVLALVLPTLVRGTLAEFWMERAVKVERGLDTALAGDYFQRAAQIADGARTLEPLARYELRAGYADRAPEVAQRAERDQHSDPYLTELRLATQAEVARLNDDAELGRATLAEAQALSARSPWDGSLHVVVGTACVATGDLECALAEFLAATDITPRRADGWSNLGRVQARMGDTASARTSLTRALELDPNDIAAAQALDQLGA